VICAAHPKYVVDASVAAKWFTRHHEPDRSKAVALRALHQTGRTRLVLPEFGLLEIVPLDWELLRKSTAIAWAYRVALYDAAYVAIAERISC
jgi:predicted nucleic acid-binding protein